MSSLYDELSVEFLLHFYFEIKKNIDKGILSEAMNFELDLIEKAAKNKGIAINDSDKNLLVH